MSAGQMAEVYMTDSLHVNKIDRLNTGNQKESIYVPRTLHNLHPVGDGRLVTMEGPGAVRLEKGVFLIIRMEPT